MTASFRLQKHAYQLVLLRCQKRLKSTIPTTREQSAEASESWFWAIWGKYTEALSKRPLTVKATTASIIFFTSDSATQYVTDSNADMDVARAASGAAFGVVATVWLHYWWGFLEGFVGALLPARQYRLANTLTKVVTDQAIGAPFYIYTYYVITNFLQQWSTPPVADAKTASSLLKETHQKASEMLMPTMMRHWTLWPAVHTLNFYYNPLHHRVLVQNLVLVGWSGCKLHKSALSKILFRPELTSTSLDI